MSLSLASKFYQKPADVKIYNKTRIGLPDSVGERIMNEMRKKRKTNGDGKLDFMIDVGCGVGRHINLFAPHFKRIVGFDVTELQIQQAQESNEFDHVTYMVGSGEAMPVGDKSVDFAALLYSAYLMDIEKVEKELLRVLKPDGVAIMYGDLLDDIDLLDSNGQIVQFSESSRKPIDLWNDMCMNPTAELSRRTKTTETRYFDRFQAIFDDLHQFRKEKIHFSYHENSTLEELIDYYYPGIPLFVKYGDSQEMNPFHEFGTEMKKLCELSQLEDKDINLRLTRGSFMILLDKPTA